MNELLNKQMYEQKQTYYLTWINKLLNKQMKAQINK